MRMVQALLAGAALSVLAAGTADAAGQVEWRDDGTVALKMGPEYDNQVITMTREDLGSEFGPGQEAVRGRHDQRHRQRCRAQGRHLRPALQLPPDLGGAVRRQGEHRRAAVRRALHQDDARSPQRHRPVRRLHGRRVLVRRHRAGRLRLRDRRADGLGQVPEMVLRRHAARAARRCTSGAASPTACSTMPTARCSTTARACWRTPSTRPAFKQQFGYDLPVPPQTWQQLLDISQLLQRQELGRQRRRAGQRHRPAPQGRRAGPLSLPVAVGLVRDQSGRQGRPDRQRLLVRPDRHEAADQQPGPRQGAGVPAGAAQDRPRRPRSAGRLGEAWDYFLRGKSVFVFSWGDVGALCQDKSRSKIAGDCAPPSILPSSNEY